MVSLNLKLYYSSEYMKSLEINISYDLFYYDWLQNKLVYNQYSVRDYELQLFILLYKFYKY